jgi:signal transduction histidine kinase
VQEALTNIARHAVARRVRIAVSAGEGRVTVEVADDGTGFDAETVDAGFGLVGMRERVALAGGALDIGSGPGGTTVRATLPARYAVAMSEPGPAT